MSKRDPCDPFQRFHLKIHVENKSKTVDFQFQNEVMLLGPVWVCIICNSGAEMLRWRDYLLGTLQSSCLTIITPLLRFEKLKQGCPPSRGKDANPAVTLCNQVDLFFTRGRNLAGHQNGDSVGMEAKSRLGMTPLILTVCGDRSPYLFRAPASSCKMKALCWLTSEGPSTSNHSMILQ